MMNFKIEIASCQFEAHHWKWKLRAVFFGLWFIDCSGQSSTFMCLLALDVLSET